MKSLTTISEIKFGGLIVLLSVSLSLAACSSTPLTACCPTSPATFSSVQSNATTRAENLEVLKSAEYRDYRNAMVFEETNPDLSNYYATKGSKAHALIIQIETSQAKKGEKMADESPSEATAIDQVLDDSESAKYDHTPPFPANDMVGAVP